MPEFFIPAKVDTFDLTNNLVGILSNDELIDFIMEMDGHISDWDFTRKLRDALTEALKDEQ